MEKQKWLVFEDSGWQVVIPDSDSKPHANVKIEEGRMELAWMDCPCNPKIALLDKIIVHNSFIDQARIDDSMKNLSDDAKNGVVHLYENPIEMDLI